jgi:uncharacterized protein (DUF983 family)
MNPDNAVACEECGHKLNRAAGPLLIASIVLGSIGLAMSILACFVSDSLATMLQMNSLALVIVLIVVLAIFLMILIGAVVLTILTYTSLIPAIIKVKKMSKAQKAEQ